MYLKSIGEMNSKDPDETAPLGTVITLNIGTDRPEQTIDQDQNVASDQGLLCHSSSTILDTSTGSKKDFFIFKYLRTLC